MWGNTHFSMFSFFGSEKNENRKRETPKNIRAILSRYKHTELGQNSTIPPNCIWLVNLTQNQIPSTLLTDDGKKSNWKSTQVDFQALLYLKGSTNLICKRKLSQIIIAMTHWNAIGCTNLLVCYFKVISGANKTQCSVFCPKKYPTQSYIVPNHSLPTRWARPPPLSHVAV